MVDRWKSLALRTKGLLVTGILLSTLLGTLVALVIVHFQEERSHVAIRHAMNVRIELEAIRPLLVNAEGGIHVYLMTRNGAGLDRYRQAAGDLPPHIQNLKELVADNEAQAECVHLIDVAAQRALRLMNQASAYPPTDPIEQGAIWSQIQGEIRAIEAEMVELQQATDGVITRHIEADDHSRKQTLLGIGTGAVAGELIGLLAVFIFLRSLSQRILSIEENARRMASREPLQIQAPINDELGRLDAALATTDTMLKEREQQLADARDELERRVVARTTELAQANKALAIEVSERSRVEETLRHSEGRFRSLVQNSSDVVLIINPHGQIRYASPSTGRVLGGKAEDRLGASAFANIHPDDVATVQGVFTELVGNPWFAPTIEFRYLRTDGAWRHLEAVGTNLLQEPTIGGIVVNLRDITERKLAEAQLAQQAFSDTLSGLPNRALFVDRLAHALTRSSRSEAHLAVFFLDLDRFKEVNDSLGHDVGDQLLIGVGRRLALCMRADDTLARFGGDEFTILAEGITNPSEITSLAERLLEAFRQPFMVGQRDIYTSCTIGIAVTDGSPTNSDDLLRKADTALYRAKAAGRACYAIHEESMDSSARQRLELETDLRLGLKRGELRLHFQPQVNLHSGTIDEIEALVRWEHPTHGLLLPGRFIPFAEESGLIFSLGRWVLEEACKHAVTWQKQFPGGSPTLAVNLSAREFHQKDLARTIASILQSTGLDPRALRLEITESILMDDVPSTLATLRRLKELGVRLAIDDFGAGYSSLNYLLRFDVDALKLDGAFASGLGKDKRYFNMIQTISNLAKGLNLEMTAEGIETADQVEMLRNAKIQRAQGFYFARPMDADRIASLIQITTDKAAAPARKLSA